MTENPYQPGQASNTAIKTRATRSLVWSGVAALLLAFLCLLATVVGMILAFNSVADASNAPTPTDLAAGISLVTLPSYAAAPLVVLGIVLVLVGLLRRQPVR